jgi:hypothetical protein
MGLFDSCIQRVPPPGSEAPLLIPQEGSCQNCHTDRPAEPLCPAVSDWPPTLFRPIEAIQRDPEAFRWWIEENHLRTALRRRTRQEVFPMEWGRHSMRIEIDPNERVLDSMFVTGDTRFTVDFGGEGMRVFLNSSPLLEGRNLGWIGSLRIFFEDHTLTSDSLLLNWFAPPHSTVLSSIPVAFDLATGATYNYTEYTRMALIRSQCGAPTAVADPFSFDGGVPPPRQAGVQEMDASSPLDLPPDFLEEMRHTAPNLGTGYADAGCGLFEAMPQRFPYLFELAYNWARRGSEATQIDLLRLYPDILSLQRLAARRRTIDSGDDSNLLSILDRVRVVWNVEPQRLAFENFILEFDPDTRENPLSITIETRGSRLQSIETDSRVRLSRLYLPGTIHLGRTTARLQGSGPELSLHLSEIDSEILPFDLGQSDPAERGWLHVNGGRVVDGEERILSGQTLRPGIHIETVHEDTFRHSVNLNFSWTVELSDGTAIDLTGNLAAVGRFRLTSSGLEPEPGGTVIALQDLAVTPAFLPARRSPPRPWATGASLLFTDRPEETPDERTGFVFRMEAPETGLPLFHGGRAEVFFPIPVTDGSYRPDFSFQDFSADLNFELFGRPGANNTRGTVHFATHQPEICTRTYEALVSLDRVRLPLGTGILLDAFPVRGRLQATQELTEDGTSHFEIPILEFSANGSGVHRGILRGPIRVFQAEGARRPVEMTYDPREERLQIQNLNLRFLMERIVIPALVESSRETPETSPQITGLDLDGRIRGRWSADTATGRGQGRVCLVGDEEDIVLRGSDGRHISDPLFSGTRWCVTSVNRFDAAHDVLFGRFFLDTTIDWGLLRYFGIHLNMRQRWLMEHRDFPLSASGYEYIERRFFGRVLEERRRREITEDLR